MTRNIKKALAIVAVALVIGMSHGPVLLGQTSAPITVPGLDKPVVVHRGPVTSDEFWVNDYYHVLRGAIFVRSGATLGIEAGTTVVGELATIGTLIVEQGARLNAVGTVDQPIVFTSDQPIGQRGRADWGGVILNGRAPINTPGGIGLGEGDTGEFGGNDPNDNSGILKYVRVEYAGIEFSPDNELNGVSFQGVGRGTTVDYVQVKHNKDDGMEFFGGTVDVKHILLTSNADDNMDWVLGWTGRVQFVAIQQQGDDADNGFEGDNNANNHDLLPRSSPTVYNATIVGDPDFNEGPESDDGIEIRVGTAGTIRNIIIMGMKEKDIDISDQSTEDQWTSGALSIQNVILFNNGEHDSTSEHLGVYTQPTVVEGTDPGLIDPYNHLNPDLRPSSVATLAGGGGALAPATPPNDGFFEVAPYIGAFAPAPAPRWSDGWANFDKN